MILDVEGHLTSTGDIFTDVAGYAHSLGLLYKQYCSLYRTVSKDKGSLLGRRYDAIAMLSILHIPKTIGIEATAIFSNMPYTHEKYVAVM